jgi:hypothetical protein
MFTFVIDLFKRRQKPGRVKPPASWAIAEAPTLPAWATAPTQSFHRIAPQGTRRGTLHGAPWVAPGSGSARPVLYPLGTRFTDSPSPDQLESMIAHLRSM